MDKLIQYAISFAGTPYRYGSDCPLGGIDCSGYVQMILKGAGLDPAGDQTAQGLYDHFDHRSTHGVYQAGSLAFYGKDLNHVEHVAFMIDSYRVMEAGGGDRTTLTLSDATAKNAFVRMRVLRYRPDFLETLRPSYALIGCN